MEVLQQEREKLQLQASWTQEKELLQKELSTSHKKVEASRHAAGPRDPSWGCFRHRPNLAVSLLCLLSWRSSWRWRRS